MILALVLSAVASAATVTDSWVGETPNRDRAQSQHLASRTAYVNLVVRPGGKDAVRVEWFRNGKKMKTVNLAGTKPAAYSSIDIRGKPGNWTAVIVNGKVRRSHHFSVG